MDGSQLSKLWKFPKTGCHREGLWTCPRGPQPNVPGLIREQLRLWKRRGLQGGPAGFYLRKLSILYAV